MAEKYMIFNKNIQLRPLFCMDKYSNGKAVEWEKKIAFDYVTKENKVHGNDLLYCMSISEWLKKQKIV